MIFTETPLKGAYLIDLERRGDERGYLTRLFCRDDFGAAGLKDCTAQISEVVNPRAHTLRGLHFQRAPHAQDKLLQVLAGTIFDVAVDIRANSPTRGQWVGLTLGAHQPRQLFVPAGFAHGYLTLSEECAVLYKTTAYYAPEAEAGLRWDDPALAIDWPAPRAAISVNDRDRTWPPFAEVMETLSSTV